MSKLQNDHPYLKKLRTLLTKLPEGQEVEAWGHPTFRAGKKLFAIFGDYEGKPAIAIKSTPAEQAGLTERPEYYLPPYVANAGWVGVRIQKVKWKEVETLLIKGYRLVALKRMLKALDGE